MITTSTRFDTEDQFSWDSIASTFEDDILIFRETVYDSGITRSEEFENGVRSSITQYDNVDPITGEAPEDGGAVSWTEQTIGYALNGKIEGRNTLFDNGVTKLEFFENGVRTTTIQYDNLDPITLEAPADGGAKTWTQQGMSYDENGTLEQRSTIFDNGIAKLEEFENGVRSSTIQYDNVDPITGEGPADGGAVSWTEQYTRYDADGVIDARETTYDNGVLRFEEFENGVRSVVTQFDSDDAVSWTQQYTTYDADGVIEYRETTYDSGIYRFEEFENGVRSVTTQFDNDDAVSWTEQSTYYDNAGAITDRETQNDDGTLKIELFEGGERTALGLFDVEDTFEWNAQATVYENGEISVRATQWDDLDELYLIYEDQALAARLEHNTDGTLELTEYGPDGPVVTDYESREGLAPEYDELLVQYINF